jgi:hypothetical protein
MQIFLLTLFTCIISINNLLYRRFVSYKIQDFFVWFDSRHQLEKKKLALRPILDSYSLGTVDCFLWDNATWEWSLQFIPVYFQR